MVLMACYGFACIIRSWCSARIESASHYHPLLYPVDFIRALLTVFAPLIQYGINHKTYPLSCEPLNLLPAKYIHSAWSPLCEGQ